MIRPMVTVLWRVLAVVSLVLALIGVVLPGLPTVPFLLVSAWAASRGWPRLERWILAVYPWHWPQNRAAVKTLSSRGHGQLHTPAYVLAQPIAFDG